MRQRSLRSSEGVFVLEGPKLVEVALDAGARLEGVYAAPAAWGQEASRCVLDRVCLAGIRVHDLAAGVMERVADTVTPQSVLAVAAAVDVALEHLRQASLVVVCAGVRDPGNAGTVMRSAEAAGADGVVFCDGSVDVYNPKAVRASAGTLLHLGVVAGGEAVEVLEQMGTWGMRRVAAVAGGGADYTTLDLRGKVAIVVGNEASGLDPALSAVLDTTASVPMRGQAKSLNVGVAAALMCFEAARQRAAG